MLSYTISRLDCLTASLYRSKNLAYFSSLGTWKGLYKVQGSLLSTYFAIDNIFHYSHYWIMKQMELQWLSAAATPSILLDLFMGSIYGVHSRAKLRQAVELPLCKEQRASLTAKWAWRGSSTSVPQWVSHPSESVTPVSQSPQWVSHCKTNCNVSTFHSIEHSIPSSRVKASKVSLSLHLVNYALYLNLQQSLQWVILHTKSL